MMQCTTHDCDSTLPYEQLPSAFSRTEEGRAPTPRRLQSRALKNQGAAHREEHANCIAGQGAVPWGTQ